MLFPTWPVTQWLLNQDVSVGGIMKILHPNLLHDIQKTYDALQDMSSSESIRLLLKQTGKTSFYNLIESGSRRFTVASVVKPYLDEHLPFFTDTSLTSNLRDIVQKVQSGLSAMHIKNADLSSLTTEIVFWFYAGNLRYSPWQCQRIDQCRHEIERGTHSIVRSVIAISEHERIEIG
jgi:hypothetical protein